MRYTLLEMVQHILSSMDSDEVNSIADTVESSQVVSLLKGVYYDLATDLGLPEHETLFELQPSNTITKPTLMSVPSNIYKVNWIKYDNKAATDTYKDYREVQFMPFDEFFQMQSGLRGLTTSVGQQNILMNSETFEIMYRSDKHPQYYTCLDDNQYFFDSYDVSVDDTLQKNKTMCHGVAYPVFTESNSFVMDLSPQQFSLFLNTAKERAFVELKQQTNVVATKEARRQKIINQKRRRITPDVPEIYKVPRYGRHG